MDALKIEKLTVNYGNIKAVKGIDIVVKEGGLVALLGSNGAGKSSTLKAISGIVPVSLGAILLFDEDITNLAPEKIVKKGIVQAPEGRQIFPELTVEENLRIGAFTIQDKKQIQKNFEMVYSYFQRLKERNKQIAGTLSGGEQQMLAIGRALMASPKVLLLDEPSLGLAPLIVKDIFNILKQLNKNGTTILIVEQNAVQTLKIADYAYVLEVGNMKHEGKTEEILKDEKLINAYLGN